MGVICFYGGRALCVAEGRVRTYFFRLLVLIFLNSVAHQRLYNWKPGKTLLWFRIGRNFEAPKGLYNIAQHRTIFIPV